MQERIKVCLVLEGSYPFITGGVSTWVHELILGLPDLDFILFTISPKLNQPVRYKFPKNIINHKDITIAKKYKSSRKPKNKKLLLKKIVKNHDSMKLNSYVEVDDIISRIPEDYFLYSDAINNNISWEFIISQNQKNNPIYPFSDYFWAWKSSHDILFTILGAKMPDADIYHAISTGYAGLSGMAAKIRKKKPLLLTEHGLYHKEREMEIRRANYIKGYQRDLWIKIFYSLSKMCYHQANLIISLFEYNRREQIKMGAKETKTIVIPNGIDTQRFSKVIRNKKKGFHIGLVGRVVPIKDIKTFISTAKIISYLIPDSHFYCIGPEDEDPGYFEDCKLLVKSFQLEGRFHFTGRDDVRKYYSFLNVLLLTSIREAQPLVILEAYCSRIPVVATKVGNVPELLDYDENLMACPKDAEKLAQGIMYIYDNPDKIETLIKKNRETVLKLYNRDDLYSKYRDIYKKLKHD